MAITKWGNKINTSIYGRRLGLQIGSTPQTGSNNGELNFLVGPDAIRLPLSTADSTGTPSIPAGVTVLVGTSVASTPVYQLDPPVAGVKKYVVFSSTDSALYIRTANGEYILGSSIGSSCTTIRSSGGGAVELVGISTSQWVALNISSSAVNGVAFQATT
jgi:hypothetical protein